MILLDTNICIYIMNAKPPRVLAHFHRFRPGEERAVWMHGELRADLERRSESIGSLDTMIAAHALGLNLVLITNNTREFSRVQGLRLENWVEPE
ncbi:MAG: hypothetical protein Q8O25_07105 [Sulfurisoma sp.]|nr:hypothetical protein [Sulfurisoma sp.]